MTFKDVRAILRMRWSEVMFPSPQIGGWAWGGELESH